ncbi:hypothetical protein [Streptomyces sp. NPDC093060]|uniref:hypothetical protein n=1 Tax=Streptomyces sp. NPDC093060 TaxID=3366019 RepID=UPI003810A9AA
MLQGYEVEKCIYDQSGNTMVVTYPTKEKLVAEVEALGYDPAIVESADEVDLNAMLAFQAMYQTEYADNAVSFTAYFPEGTRPQTPYERITAEAARGASAPHRHSSLR